MWNKQRKDEVLIDVEDVALGHTTKLRWNETDKWLWSDKIVQPPIIDRDVFDQVQAMVAGARQQARRAQAAPPASTPTRCAACLRCGLCGRKMSAQMNNDLGRLPVGYGSQRAVHGTSQR